MDLAASTREAIEHARTQLRDGDDVMAAALLAILELWQDPGAVAGRPLPEGEVAQAMWHYDVGRAGGINEAVMAIAEKLGIEVS